MTLRFIRIYRAQQESRRLLTCHHNRHSMYTEQDGSGGVPGLCTPSVWLLSSYFFMCHKYHIKDKPEQCNLDRVQSESKKERRFRPVRCENLSFRHQTTWELQELKRVKKTDWLFAKQSSRVCKLFANSLVEDCQNRGVERVQWTHRVNQMPTRAVPDLSWRYRTEFKLASCCLLHFGSNQRLATAISVRTAREVTGRISTVWTMTLRSIEICQARPDSGRLLAHHHHILSKKYTACTQSKMGWWRTWVVYKPSVWLPSLYIYLSQVPHHDVIDVDVKDVYW